ncbi:MAG: hypothetical protein IT385_29060 [Deltaproteobacteria bacterium]|nr:hypothetical protein [Deltaproteobacteria bacterium]
MSWSLTLDVNDAYVFRGLVEETEGVVVQPGLEAFITLARFDGVVSSLDLVVSQWSSWHTGPTGDSAGDGPAGWYEHDFGVGASMTFGTGSELSTRLWTYMSPNGRFTTQWELETWCYLDDSAVWRDLGSFFRGLYPSAIFSVEIEGTNAGEEEGLYLELGLTPRFDFFRSEGLVLAFQIPMTLGLGLGPDFYDFGDGTPGDTLGATQIGAMLRAELAGIPESWGAWQLYAAGRLFFLGEQAARISGGDDTATLFTVGLIADL